MGMFDYVNYQADCDKCGQPLSDFQSKDGPCELGFLAASDVDYFYTSCSKCRTWHDFKVHRVSIVKGIDVSSYSLP
jgi:hypothetical protein